MISLETARALHDWVHYSILVATVSCIIGSFVILWPDYTYKSKPSKADGEGKEKKNPPLRDKK
ncbi:MAG: hypothetical protein HY052_02030 [Proteobacteria bacterium]|nr:hypothetical protein [Pseudomonadota bacterium]